MNISYCWKSTIFPNKRALCCSFIFRNFGWNINRYRHLHIFVVTFVRVESRNMFLNDSQSFEFSNGCVHYVQVRNQLDSIAFHFGVESYTRHKDRDRWEWPISYSAQNSFELVEYIKLELEITFILRLDSYSVAFFYAANTLTHAHDITKRYVEVSWFGFLLNQVSQFFVLQLVFRFKLQFIRCYVQHPIKWFNGLTHLEFTFEVLMFVAVVTLWFRNDSG